MGKVIWSLFDGSGYAVIDYAKAGYKCYCFNADDADHGPYSAVKLSHPNITYVNVWLDDTFDYPVPPDLILAFPPCTDLAVSGAAHFASKLAKDPEFQNKAVATAKLAECLAGKYTVPYMIENPVSVLSSKWRKPDYSFHPYQYGGYLDADDNHPDFPEYIKPRDAYPKKTCLWVGNGFKMPEFKPVEVEKGYSAQHSKLGGKSAKTKVIRSLTPRGFARAVFLANQ
jgi:hypothetical protein